MQLPLNIEFTVGKIPTLGVIDTQFSYIHAHADFLFDNLYAYFSTLGYKTARIGYPLYCICGKDVDRLLNHCESAEIILVDDINILPYREIFNRLQFSSALVIACGDTPLDILSFGYYTLGDDITCTKIIRVA